MPQFLARPEFIDELEATASDAAAVFCEIALDLPRAAAIEAFDNRSAAPTHATHIDAAALVDRSANHQAVGDMYDRLHRLLVTRPNVRVVAVSINDVEATLQSVLAEIANSGIDW